MHHALQIVEVVEMICAQLAPDARTLHKHTRDLSRLARTSTIFLDPALDVLWSHQGTLVNLLRTMPNDLWDIVETKNGDDDDAVIDLHIALRRAVAFADWERFLFYSRRVKSFSVDLQGFLDTQEVYETLSSCFPEDHIFPSLRKIDWFPLTAESSRHIGLFLAPGITHLRLTIETISHLSLLSTLADKCPRLTIVSIATPRVPAVASILPISKFVCALRPIESLVVSGLNQAALAHIAQFPGLHYLWLMSSQIPITSLQRPARSPHFPALITLKCETMEDVPALLEYLNCSLETFTLLSRGRRVPPTKSTTQELYSALATHCSHLALQEIIVQKGWYSVPIHAGQRELYTVGGEILRPLFCFRNLVMVSLAHTVGIDLDDAVVSDMARAWPRIEFLSLPPDHAYRVSSRVTLEGIYAFAQHCPRLEELSMAFDATVAPKTKIDGRKRASQASLYELDVASSPIGKPRPIAKFLSAIFPNLETIRADGTSVNPQDVGFHKGWRQVQNALQDF